jgi:hypothetical protein
MFGSNCGLTLVPFVLVCAVAAADRQDGFVDLFNGRDLDNWVLTNTAPETWTIKDGMLVCSGRPYGEIRTRQMYQNFVFEVEWRHLVPAGNAGIFLWADDIPAKGVPFHRGIEVQILDHAYGNTRSHTTHGDIFPIHGARMTPDNGRGGSRSFPTELRGRPAPEWNHYRITCDDGTVSLEVNGAKVTSGKNCSPRRGYLCLESEGGIVHYRNLRIKELPDTPVDDRNIAIASHGYQSIYSGLNLSGWRTTGGALVDTVESNGWRSADWTLQHRGPATGITSTELAGGTGFLLDVRRNAEDASGRIVLQSGGSHTTLVSIAAKDSTQEVEEAPGKWNRIECDWTDDELRLLVNGNPVPLIAALSVDGADPTIVLHGDGALDFANIFVRAVAK